MNTQTWTDPESHFEFVCLYEIVPDDFGKGEYPDEPAYAVLYEVLIQEKYINYDIYPLLNVETIREIEISLLKGHTNEAL